MLALISINADPGAAQLAGRRARAYAPNHGNLADQLDEGVGTMPHINLPHVLHTFDACDRGCRTLIVATDLAMNPAAPGFDEEALHALNSELGKLVDLRTGYDKVVVLHFSPVA
jgi:hypothetical protein